MSESANIVIRIGTHNEEVFAVEDADGVPEVITGNQYRLMVRQNVDKTTTLATYTCAVTSGGGGEFTCTLSSASSSTLTPLDAVFDLEETSTSGEPVILFGGRARIRKPVTR